MGSASNSTIEVKSFFFLLCRWLCRFLSARFAAWWIDNDFISNTLQRVNHCVYGECDFIFGSFSIRNSFLYEIYFYLFILFLHCSLSLSRPFVDAVHLSLWNSNCAIRTYRTSYNYPGRHWFVHRYWLNHKSNVHCKTFTWTTSRYFMGT